ncbi:MAG TPA: aminotransferase class I/II-fold pyridoxal phosphate-dependent enzyme [Thermoanaerobaculia bacterium]|nr:aminotransferase class I/II-fold pyridoxal phosphate-dependent enzyme [Thermoanaerobaculia bacterium]
MDSEAQAPSKRSGSTGRGASTRAVHGGEEQLVPRAAAVVPIYQTAPFRFDSSAELVAAFAADEPGGLYSRYRNPTVRAVEEKLAALEGAEDAVAFASGTAAVAAALTSSLASGDHLILAADLYGGTRSLVERLRRRQPEISSEEVPLARLAERLGEGVPANTRAVLLETPSNPLLTSCNLDQVAELAKRAGSLLLVDNTFATPILQNPLVHGADLVIHSATKYLAGHSDVVAGLVAGGGNLIAQVRRSQIAEGACLDPHAAFLLGRGMKTLALRVERQSANAARLAEVLASHPQVTRLRYPGLDPVARAQMRAGGGMLAFDLAAGAEGAHAFVDRLEIFKILPSLGGVESSVMLPTAASHRDLPPAERDALGISDATVRLSVGIEDGDDLEADLRQALERS